MYTFPFQSDTVNTATHTPPHTETADRFRCESDVPDPPRDAAGRKQYWEDTVAELRRRLASRFDAKSFEALQMILDLKKIRLRHKTPVAGAQVETRWSSGLRPMEECLPRGGLASRDRQGAASSDETPMPLLGGRGSQDPMPLPGGCGSQDPMSLPGGRGSQDPRAADPAFVGIPTRHIAGRRIRCLRTSPDGACPCSATRPPPRST